MDELDQQGTMGAKPNVIRSLASRLEPVLRAYGIDKAILFGSLARQEASPTSDVDLILIQRTSKRFFDRYDGILEAMGSAVPERDLEVLIYTPEELEGIRNRPFVRRALLEGKVLFESN